MASSASASSTAPQTRSRNRQFSVQEVIEAIQTAGSDVEDNESSDSDDETIQGSYARDSDVDSDENVAASDSHESDSDSASVEAVPVCDRAANQDLSEDQFLEFLLQDWSTDFSFFPILPPYSSDDVCGLHVDHMESHAPFDFFREIFDNALFDNIVVQTNKYANENIAAKGELKRNSIFRQWPQAGINRNNLLGFLTICVHMALDHKPHITDYWTNSPILTCPFAANIMSRDKFFLLLAVLHVSDNDYFVPRHRPGHDPLQKIRPVYEHLRRKFRSLYTPRGNICVDEAMCPWRGKLAFRVYMKDKPVKWGIKLYELCESETAYVYDFEIYAGLPGLSNRPVDVVVRLVAPLLDRGRTVYMDNYYCCPELAEILVQRDTHAVGTVRPNRKGLPPQLKTERNPPQGHVHAYRQGAVSVLRWMDKKPVHVLTTKVDPKQMMNIISRNNPNNQKMKPVAVQDYINNMSGRGRKKKPLKKFVEELGLAMNDKYQAGVAAATEQAADNPQHPAVPGTSHTTATTPQTRLSGTGHYSIPIGQVASGSGRKKFRKCHVCFMKSKRHAGVNVRKTSNQCAKCGTSLCNKLIQPGQNRNITCFKLYHTVQHYVDY